MPPAAALMLHLTPERHAFAVAITHATAIRCYADAVVYAICYGADAEPPEAPALRSTVIFATLRCFFVRAAVHAAAATFPLTPVVKDVRYFERHHENAGAAVILL